MLLSSTLPSADCSLPPSHTLFLSLSLPALWMCMKAAACKYLITNKLSPSYSLYSRWVEELHFSLKIALMLHISSFSSAQSPTKFIIIDSKGHFTAFQHCCNGLVTGVTCRWRLWCLWYLLIFSKYYSSWTVLHHSLLWHQRMMEK